MSGVSINQGPRDGRKRVGKYRCATGNWLTKAADCVGYGVLKQTVGGEEWVVIRVGEMSSLAGYCEGCAVPDSCREAVHLMSITVSNRYDGIVEGGMSSCRGQHGGTATLGTESQRDSGIQKEECQEAFCHVG